MLTIATAMRSYPQLSRMALPTKALSIKQPYPWAIFELEEGEVDGVIFVHARGYIHAAPSKVWEALMDPDVVANRRDVDSVTATFDVEPEYEFSMILS